jgi:hypothetical protein
MLAAMWAAAGNAARGSLGFVRFLDFEDQTGPGRWRRWGIHDSKALSEGRVHLGRNCGQARLCSIDRRDFSVEIGSDFLSGARAPSFSPGRQALNADVVSGTLHPVVGRLAVSSGGLQRCTSHP